MHLKFLFIIYNSCQFEIFSLPLDDRRIWKGLKLGGIAAAANIQSFIIFEVSLRITLQCLKFKTIG